MANAVVMKWFDAHHDQHFAPQYVLCVTAVQRIPLSIVTIRLVHAWTYVHKMASKYMVIYR